jgi:TorA maturation chaperone TorD
MNKQKRKEFLHTIKITSTVNITQQWNLQAKIKNVTAQFHNLFLMPWSNSLTHYRDHVSH